MKKALLLFILLFPFNSFSNKALIKLDVKKNKTNRSIAKIIETEKSYQNIHTDSKIRIVFTEYQRSVENALLSYAKKHKNAKLIMAIHTPLPATPLRITGQYLKTIADKDIRNNVKLRGETIRKIMQLQNVKYLSINYLTNDDKEIVGIENYNTLFTNKKNNIKEFKNPEYKKTLLNGATYILEENGKSIIFSIEADQLKGNAETKLWKLYLNDYDSLPEEIKKRVDLIKSLT